MSAMQEPQYPTLNINTEKVTFEKFYFGASARVASYVLRELAAQHRDQPLRMGVVYQELSPIYDEMLISIRAWMLKSMHEEVRTITITAPATWWDHLKDDFLKSESKFKVWLAQRFAPPQYVTNSKEYKENIRVCPHNDTYFSESQQHMQWLLWRNDPDGAKPWL